MNEENKCFLSTSGPAKNRRAKSQWTARTFFFLVFCSLGKNGRNERRDGKNSIAMLFPTLHAEAFLINYVYKAKLNFWTLPDFEADSMLSNRIKWCAVYILPKCQPCRKGNKLRLVCINWSLGTKWFTVYTWPNISNMCFNSCKDDFNILLN